MMHTEDEMKDLAGYMITEIEVAIDENDFQMDLFLSLERQFVRFGRLTEKQFEALERIYQRVVT